ncbi:helix-turn-helix domain-containing protein [Micromonospora sp. NPDC048898]|uniref:AraC-like ligand-binding domain-containing protein n=1 Tax=Micromonospora sp. NPDC048898 TaxID=3364260 RepID=UPI003711C8DF
MDVISTDHLPPGERFDFWRDVNAKVFVPYDLRCDPQLERGFRGRVDVTGFGGVQAILITSMPHSVHRTPKLIRQADPEVFKLGCMVRGAGMIVQDRRHAHFGVGELMLFDTSRPYVAELHPHVPVSQLLLLRFPRTLLPLPARDVRKLGALRLPAAGGVAALSSQFLLQLARRMGELSPVDTTRLSTLALDVLTVALADALETQAVVPRQSRRRALVAQIHAYVREHLGDANLTPESIAATHHISVRYLHKLFEEEEHTVAGWVRQRRLEQCRRDLAEPELSGRSIQAIAGQWGFRNPTHFSQAFRSAYGLSPLQFRRQTAAVHADRTGVHGIAWTSPDTP